jgi:hypothetical protein
VEVVGLRDRLGSALRREGGLGCADRERSDNEQRERVERFIAGIS